jgi:hypothetical protein
VERKTGGYVPVGLLRSYGPAEKDEGESIDEPLRWSVVQHDPSVA